MPLTEEMRYPGIPVHLRTKKKVTNPWGNLSYADLITLAILDSPQQGFTLNQIYQWISTHIPFFHGADTDNCTAPWKNGIRHTLSVFNQFKRTQLTLESTSKTLLHSVWTVDIGMNASKMVCNGDVGKSDSCDMIRPVVFNGLVVWPDDLLPGSHAEPLISRPIHNQDQIESLRRTIKPNEGIFQESTKTPLSATQSQVIANQQSISKSGSDICKFFGQVQTAYIKGIINATVNNKNTSLVLDSPKHKNVQKRPRLSTDNDDDDLLSSSDDSNSSAGNSSITGLRTRTNSEPQYSYDISQSVEETTSSEDDKNTNSGQPELTYDISQSFEDCHSTCNSTRNDNDSSVDSDSDPDYRPSSSAFSDSSCSSKPTKPQRLDTLCYSKLIVQAISSAPTQQLTEHGIYEWFRLNVDGCRSQWKIRIKKTLLTQRDFVLTFAGDQSYWKVQSDTSDCPRELNLNSNTYCSTSSPQQEVVPKLPGFSQAHQRSSNLTSPNKTISLVVKKEPIEMIDKESDICAKTNAETKSVLAGCNEQNTKMPLLKLRVSKKDARNPWGKACYSDLIAEAILGSENQRLTLQDIYDWFEENVPHIRQQPKGNSSLRWKNTIRHTLSLQSCFTKSLDDPTYWTVDISIKPTSGRNCTTAEVPAQKWTFASSLQSFRRPTKHSLAHPWRGMTSMYMLIAQALLRAPGRRLTLEGIYNWFCEKVPSCQQLPPDATATALSWKNAIELALKSEDGFIVEKSGDQTYWKLDDLTDAKIKASEVNNMAKDPWRDILQTTSSL